MSEQQFLSGIKVVYGDKQSEEPTDRIRELNKKSDNINDGFGGKFVWLVPEYAPKERDPLRDDLAKGAGGDYRYLILVKNNKDMAQPEKITEIALLRLDGTVGDGQKSDWKYSSNINEGRGQPALYLIWKISSA